MEISLEEVVKLAQETASDTWGPRDPLKLIEKLQEEVAELESALEILKGVEEDSPTIIEDKLSVLKEMGDVLFCVVRLAHNLNVDIRDALEMTVVKIQERVKFGVAGGGKYK